MQNSRKLKLFKTLKLKFKNPSNDEKILANLDFGVNPGVSEDVKVTVSSAFDRYGRGGCRCQCLRRLLLPNRVDLQTGNQRRIHI